MGMARVSTPIDLASTESFLIGPLRIVPAAREVVRDGTREMIEPLVMQVLTVLARSEGSVVSRDELIERCWDGRAISEDALNRVVAKIRRIADGIGRGAFRVETVTKVGYRLQLDQYGSRAPVSSAAVVARQSSAGRRLFLGATGAAFLTGSFFLIRRPERRLKPAAPQPSAQLVGAAADLETRGLSLLFQGNPELTDEGISYLRQATALTPGRATLWGSLAMGYVLSLSYSSLAASVPTISRAEEAARRGLAIDPHEGRSIAALVSLRPTFRHWAEKDAQLNHAFAQAVPQTPPLMFQRAQFLASVGRTNEALELTEKLVAISPLLPWIQSLHVNLLAARGRLEDAQLVADHAASLWPRDRLTWFTRCDLALYGGRPGDAVAMTEEHSRWPTDSASDVADRRSIARALINREGVDSHQLIDSIAKRATENRTAAETAVQAATAFGLTDRAILLAHKMYAQAGNLPSRGVIMPRIGADDGRERNTAMLFWLPAMRIRSAPGYGTLLRNLGLDPAMR